jgi:hypothetical protein
MAASEKEVQRRKHQGVCVKGDEEKKMNSWNFFSSFI